MTDRPVRSFAIVGQPRSGTGSLYELFGDLGVDIEHEPFRPAKWEGPHEAKRYEIENELSRLYRGHDAIKHLWPHVPEPINGRILDWLRQHGVSVIHLLRRDRLGQAISQLLAERTGFWGVEAPGEADAYRQRAGQTRLEIDALRRRTDDLEQVDARYAESIAASRHIRVAYEDLYAADPSKRGKTAAQLAAFVGLSTSDDAFDAALHRLAPRRKQTTAEIYAAIANIDEIERAFGKPLR